MARKFATVDCETDPFKHGRIPKPFIWGFYDGETFLYFYDTNEFIDHVKNFEGIIYAHNGGKFDYHFLMAGIEAQEKIMVINGRIAKMKMGKAELRDSFMNLPVPLSAYKKDEISYDIFEEGERRKIKNMAKIIEYLRGDCVYLYEVLQTQFDDYGQKLTLASSAFDFWHKKFNADKYKPRTSPAFFEKFKSFYFGGRVECFRKGIIEEQFEVYDITSAYPYAMLSEHPWGNAYEIKNRINEKTLEKSFVKFEGISKGVLPVRIDGKLCFPTDDEKRVFNATGHELKLGLEKGLIKISRIERVYEFQETINFSRYVDHFFKMKAEQKGKNEARYLLAKLYMNSLYGKFGQSSLDHREYALIEMTDILSYMDDGWEHEGEMGTLAIVSKPIDEKNMKFFNVATAASITGFVRAYLYSHILSAKGPIYCDTDSLACIKFNGKQGKNLGEWEKEGVFSRGAVAGKKLYAFKYLDGVKGKKYKISSKGARLNEKQIFSIAKGGTISYKQDAPSFRVGKTTDFLVRKIRMT